MTSATDSLGIAIVGAGRMGLQHARVVRAAGSGVHLRALVDPSPVAVELAAEQFPDVPRFSSLTEAAEVGAIHAVHVCTPQHTHYTVALGAIQRGHHVFVEKPFTRTGAEARSLFAAARERDLSICAGHQLLFEPAYQQLVAQLPLLNEIVHVESYFSFAPSHGTPTGRPGLGPEEQLMDILPHPLYLLLDALKHAAPRDEPELVGVRMARSGTIHALISRGSVTASLVVTLRGRPVESTLRVVGSSGEVQADLVRGITREQIGPGRSSLDKVAAPYVHAVQGTTRTTRVLLRRVLRRQRMYPSLTDLVTAWYATFQGDRTGSPTPEEDVLDTVDAFETIVERTGLGAPETGPSVATSVSDDRPHVVVTGGTGWLGAEVVRRLSEGGARVTAVSRRIPSPSACAAAVGYVQSDLAEGISPTVLEGALCVVHCAAETAGGRAAHERNSIQATENLVAAMREAGVPRLLHVSSLAVLSQAAGPVSEDSPLQPDPEAAGPYTWGKTLSEAFVAQVQDLEVHIVRPAAIIDSRAFEPPGKLGKGVGPIFVGVGGRREILGVVELEWAAEAIAWMALHFDDAPSRINLLDPRLPTRRDLFQRLKATNPTVHVVRIPRIAISVGGLGILALSKLLRPGKKAIDIRRVFARQRFDNRRSTELRDRIRGSTTVREAPGASMPMSAG